MTTSHAVPQISYDDHPSEGAIDHPTAGAIDHPTAGAVHDATVGDVAEYRPGACNIGSAEIAVRRRFGIAAVSVAALLGVGLIAVGAPPATRLLVGIPLASGTVGLLQARLRFCAGFAMSGVSNFGPLGTTSTVEDAAARAADRRRAGQIFAGSALTGLAGGVALALLPF